MRNVVYVLVIFIVLTIIDCNSNQQPLKRKKGITRISFATGGCYGNCPFMALEIDSSLTYRFYGGENTSKQGFYQGRITQDFWDTLNSQLKSIHYQRLDTEYNHSVDGLSTEIIITDSLNKKHIIGQFSDMPDSVKAVYRWLMDSYKSIPLLATQDSLELETIIQFPIKKIHIDFKAPK